MRGGSAVVLPLREDVTRLLYPAFIRARGWVPWVRYLRQLTSVELHQQIFDADAGTRAVFGLWTLRVDCTPTRRQHCHHRQLTMRLIFHSGISCPNTMIDELFLFLLKVAAVLI